jgi:4-amino-4-deoxy-L-arabinose transferase-like glycosyltransferase
MYYQGAEDAEEWRRNLAVQQWKEQPVQEPEIMEHLAAWTYRVIGHEDIFFPRLYASLFWLLGGLALYFLLGSIIGIDGALIGLGFYLFNPYGISASRAFMPDPLMIAALLWSAWAVWRWSQKPGWGRAVLAGLLCGLTVYIKLTAVFFIAGAMLGLALGQFGFRKAVRQAQFWVMGLLALLPGVIYNYIGIYMAKFIGSSAVANRLIPAMLVDILSYIRWNTMIVSVVGYVAFFLGLVGLFVLDTRAKKSLVIGLWAGYLLFGFVFIYYFTTHDYYHLALVPLTAIGLAALGDALLKKASELIKPGWFFRTLILAAAMACVLETVWMVRNDFKRTDYRSQAAFWESLGDELRGYNTLAMTEDYNGRLSYYGWFEAAYMPELAELTHRELAGHEGGIAETFAPLAEGRDLFLVTLMDDLNAEPEFKAFLDQTYPLFDVGQGYIIYDLRSQDQ